MMHTRKEEEYLIGNLSTLMSSGMDMLEALSAVALDVRSKKMRVRIQSIRADVESGSPLWRALDSQHFFPPHVLSLIRIGEESGRLSEHLAMVSAGQEKDRMFRSKVSSAMMYPFFVLVLTAVIGIGIAWFVLPKLAVVFSQLNLELPLLTKLLIRTGIFLNAYGMVVVPLAAASSAILLYGIFFFPKTNFIGQTFLLSLPGVRRLIQEVELARFGYLLGTLLQAGISITQALQSLSQASFFQKYKKITARLATSIEEGNSFQKSFQLIRPSTALIPLSVQQLVVAGERSGRLADTLLTLHRTYEEKTEVTSKNLTVILEPVLLVIVWLGVVAVALAVILPIYNLVGGFETSEQTQPSASPQPVFEEVPAKIIPPEIPAPTILPETSSSSSPAARDIFREVQRLRIRTTETGYLTVREQPSRLSAAVGRVIPGELYEYSAEQNGWYEISLPEEKKGWVLGRYVSLVE